MSCMNTTTYRSTLVMDRYYDHHTKTYKRTLNVKLSNDGYLYSKNEEWNTFKNNIRRHDGDRRWCALDKTEVIQWFQPLISFAQSYLESTHIKCQAFHIYYVDRIDFGAYCADTNESLTVTYEPWSPFVDFEEDFWIEYGVEQNTAL